MFKHKSKKGFTIVELVIVIAVVAILAAVLIPSFSSLNKKAKESAYLQERTNQQIADLAEKVENQNYLTWEDFEKKLAEELAKNDIATAVSTALESYMSSLEKEETGLTEAQVKTIIEKALEGQLTTAQVEAIVKEAVKTQFPSDDSETGTSLTAADVQKIVDDAIAKLNKQTGITKEEMEKAIAEAIAKNKGVTTDDVQQAINNALAGFNNNGLTKGEVEDVIEDALAGFDNGLSKEEIENIIKDALANQGGNDTPIAVTGVILDVTSLELTVGDITTLTATVAPSNAADKGVVWSSVDSEIASVNNGAVTGKKAGTTTITVTTVDGGFSATCVVTVKEATPAYVEVYNATDLIGALDAGAPYVKVMANFNADHTFNYAHDAVIDLNGKVINYIGDGSGLFAVSNGAKVVLENGDINAFVAEGVVFDVTSAGLDLNNVHLYVSGNKNGATVSGISIGGDQATVKLTGSDITMPGSAAQVGNITYSGQYSAIEFAGSATNSSFIMDGGEVAFEGDGSMSFIYAESKTGATASNTIAINNADIAMTQTDADGYSWAIVFEVKNTISNLTVSNTKIALAAAGTGKEAALNYRNGNSGSVYATPFAGAIVYNNVELELTNVKNLEDSSYADKNDFGGTFTINGGSCIGYDLTTWTASGYTYNP